MVLHPALCLLLAIWPVWAHGHAADAATGPLRRFGGMRAAMGRADPRFRTMLERFAWSTSVRPGNARNDSGRPRGSKRSTAEKWPASTSMAIDHALGAMDGNTSIQARQTLGWGREKKRVTKRMLKKQLQECRSSLEECQTSLAAPSFLYVQMAGQCTLDKNGDRYFLRTEDMDMDTYVFSDRPYTYASTLPTSYFIGYLFDRYFASSRPNAAFTFNVFQNESEATFEGPLISIMLTAQNMLLQNDNSTLIVYELGQSSEQQQVTPLSGFFPGIDPDGTASVTFQYCSVFIDPGDEFPPVVIEPVESIDTAGRRLSLNAAFVENGPPPGPSSSTSALRKYARVWQYKDAEGKKAGGVEAKVRR